ncbi:MAG: hypothetical protein MI974_09610 [Chitinophagales bacterium]|nr:hypothetical protein [Chitinophagales bacterium]
METQFARKIGKKYYSITDLQNSISDLQIVVIKLPDLEFGDTIWRSVVR